MTTRRISELEPVSNVLNDASFVVVQEGSTYRATYQTVLNAARSNDWVTLDNILNNSENLAGLDFGRSILPSSNSIHSLGSSTQRWKDLYLSSNTIFIGDASIGTNGKFLVLSSNSEVDGVQIIANDWVTLLSALANDWATHNDLSGNIYQTYSNAVATAYANDLLSYNTVTANLYQTYSLVTANLGQAVNSVTANLYQTYSDITANLGQTNNAVTANLYQTHSLVTANLGQTNNAVTANLYQTYSLVTANLGQAVNAVTSNLYQTYSLVTANLGQTNNAVTANLYQTHSLVTANLYQTYSLVTANLGQTNNAVTSNLYQTHSISQANDWTTLDNILNNPAIMFGSDKTFLGDVNIYGNIIISGNTFQANVQTLVIEDNTINLNFGGTTATAENAGLHIEADGLIVGSLHYKLASRSGWRLGKGDLSISSSADDDVARFGDVQSNDWATYSNSVITSYANDRVTYVVLTQNIGATADTLTSNIYETYRQTTANLYQTYDSLAVNTYATYSNITANLGQTNNAVTSNLYQTYSLVTANLGQAVNAVTSNLYQTYSLVTANLGQTNNAVTANLYQTHSLVTANLGQTNNAVTANLYQTYSLVTHNIYATYSGITSNLYETYSLVTANLGQTNNAVTANLYQTYIGITSNLGQTNNAVTANLYQTYSDITANLYQSQISLVQNTGATFNSLSSNDYITYSGITSNLYTTYSNLIQSIQASTAGSDSNIYATYANLVTTYRLQGNLVSTGITKLDFVGPGVNVYVESNNLTINISGGVGAAAFANDWATYTNLVSNSAVHISDGVVPDLGNNFLWWNSSDGILYIRYLDGDSSQWVPATAPLVGSPLESNDWVTYNNIINSNSYPFTSNKTFNKDIISSNVIPRSNNQYSLGTPDIRWKDLWVSNGSIYVGDVVISTQGNTLILPTDTQVGDEPVNLVINKVQGTTSLLGKDVVGYLTLHCGQAYTLYKIQTSKSARVRVYTNELGRDLDRFRPIGIAANTSYGLITEVITTGPDTVAFAPALNGYNDEIVPTSSTPISVTNLTDPVSNVTVMLTKMTLIG